MESAISRNEKPVTATKREDAASAFIVFTSPAGRVANVIV